MPIYTQGSGSPHGNPSRRIKSHQCASFGMCPRHMPKQLRAHAFLVPTRASMCHPTSSLPFLPQPCVPRVPACGPPVPDVCLARASPPHASRATRTNQGANPAPGPRASQARVPAEPSRHQGASISRQARMPARPACQPGRFLHQGHQSRARLACQPGPRASRAVHSLLYLQRISGFWTPAVQPVCG